MNAKIKREKASAKSKRQKKKAKKKRVDKQLLQVIHEEPEEYESDSADELERETMIYGIQDYLSLNHMKNRTIKS